MRAIELFAGAGGLGLGMSKAGIRPVEVVEWDRWCCDTIRENRARNLGLVAKWPEPREEDVRGIDFQGYAGKVDIVSGGPPCQPFSLGGKHRAHADNRDMWSEAVRSVREIRPKAFIFENVKGLTRTSFATYFQYVLLQLTYPSLFRKCIEDWREHLARLQQHHTGKPSDNEEYRTVFQVLNAADYGVPQKRERVVFVGFRADLGIEWSFPKPTHSWDSLLWDQSKTEEYWERHRLPQSHRTLDATTYLRGISLNERPSTKPWQTVRDALYGLPDPQIERDKPEEITNHRFQSGARSYPGHTGSRLDEPAKTLKAGVHGVPGGENMLLMPDGRVRYFTVREGARIQTFPDDFVFHGSWSETMRQLGNAVPVRLAEVIGKSVHQQLRGG